MKPAFTESNIHHVNAYARAAMALALALICLPAIGAGQHGDGHNHGSVPENGRFTPNTQGGTFPPQPRGITNERFFDPSAVAPAKAGSSSGSAATRSVKAATAAAREAATTTAAGNADVRNKLGLRYAHIDTRPVRQKWAGGADSIAERYEVVFYSHSNNQSVNVTVEGGELDDVRVTPASAGQPPLATSEMNEAIGLARTWWENQGNSAVDTLTGFAIQTYEPDGTTHNTRMVYVSFHPSSEQLPQLLTWVDLSNRRVVRAELSQ